MTTHNTYPFLFMWTRTNSEIRTENLKSVTKLHFLFIKYLPSFLILLATWPSKHHYIITPMAAAIALTLFLGALVTKKYPKYTKGYIAIVLGFFLLDMALRFHPDSDFHFVMMVFNRIFFSSLLFYWIVYSYAWDVYLTHFKAYRVLGRVGVYACEYEQRSYRRTVGIFSALTILLVLALSAQSYMLYSYTMAKRILLKEMEAKNANR